ncbi:glycosyltransferase family 2 protein [Flavobacterium sp. 7A]|uniref:glycosyltransferase family 2 protein n=1 Tax=Flavobacterium sp. 7A TaxID=2940571 RepID=UPI002225C57B|nr:glycosyltransferase family 2 protein [Flavobacterium sp. 7A]MCW2119415.1 rhamnosyltransferase [Flavobacterium sp. 7A]
MTVDILLATYNGAKYVEAQIHSIISQSHKDWRLVIHDDGSKDNTVTIIKKFSAVDSRIMLVDDGVSFGNAGQNFMYLLQFSSADYIMFCDQDDIWFDNKLDVLYQEIKNKEFPCAVYCNADAYDGSKVVSKNITLFHRSTLENSLFLNSGVQGCSLMFNRKLLNCLKEFPNYVYMHDHLITIASVTFGKLFHIDDSLMLYRQHDSNVTGNINNSLLSRMKQFLFTRNSVIDKKHYEANLSFFEKYSPVISRKNKEIFNAYFAYPKKNRLERLGIILKYQFVIGNHYSILFVKTLLRKPI